MKEMDKDETLIKHCIYIDECKSNSKKSESKYSTFRNIEIIYSIILFGLFFYDIYIAQIFLFVAVIWILLTNRNSFYSQWHYSELNLREAEINFKIAELNFKKKDKEQ
jgi:hypothetical protein